MLCNPYFIGKICYRGMTVRPKGVSYRSTPPQFSEGQKVQSRFSATETTVTYESETKYKEIIG